MPPSDEIASVAAPQDDPVKSEDGPGLELPNNGTIKAAPVERVSSPTSSGELAAEKAATNLQPLEKSPAPKDAEVVVRPALTANQHLSDESFHDHNPIEIAATGVHHAGMEVDDQGFDSDSAYGGSCVPSTTSIRSSIYEYVEENGRTYHAFKAGKYCHPNDEAEQDRLDLQHHLFLLTLDQKLHLAPLEKDIHNVLDIATGTGLWAIEFAQQFPSADVLGSDLSPIQPMYLPPNCRFEVDDVEEEWLYTHKFDYIHGRALLSSFANPALVIQRAANALEPGGWLELQDPCCPIRCIDDSMSGSALEEWTQTTCRAAAALGRPWTNVRNYRRFMEDAGLVDIVEHNFYWPTSPWPRAKKDKLRGAWLQQNLLDGLQGMSMAVLTRGLGWSAAQVELLLARTRKDIKNRAIHAYMDVVVIYGRKPH